MTVAYPEPRPKERVKHPDFYVLQNQECDQHAEKALAAFEAKVTVPASDLSRLRSAEKRQEAVQRHHLKEMTGADLTKLPGLDLLAVQRILSEIGLDMSRWPGEKHFCAWLNVAPNNRISGGKILSSKPRKNANRAAAALRRFPPEFYALQVHECDARSECERGAAINARAWCGRLKRA